ncbi:hypothetical protein LXL04_003447 [Taraxacum kok-saghyz]
MKGENGTDFMGLNFKEEATEAGVMRMVLEKLMVKKLKRKGEDCNFNMENMEYSQVVDWNDLHEMVTATCYTPDGQVVLRKSKRLTMREKYKQHEIEHVGDYISNLHDCILHHILSFMPTKEVVKTSALSKRWKNLWASVPSIDFDDELLSINGRARPHVTSFVKFVERVLRLRDASNMKKFRLSCGVFRDGFQIYAWIFHAVMHNVEELDICLLEVDPSVIPRCVFDSTSLVSLKIELNVVQLPSHIHLPCLKSLHLSYLQFLSDDYTDNLFSGCPVLEKLILSDCMVIHLNNIVISIPSLKSLTIDDYSDFEADDDSTGCKLKIDAPNLTYFEYIGHMSSEILLNDNASSSLVKACIHIPLPKERQTEVACRALDLLKRLQNVVSLSLSIDTMESLICTDNMALHFPVFANLTDLVLTKEMDNYTCRALMDMLYFCPVLQSICLSEGFEECVDFRENDRIWFLVPSCVSNCLKTVNFRNFCGIDCEVFFLKRVLKYGHVLERMNVVLRKSKRLTMREKYKQHEIEHVGDYISNLPDCILHHILSFMPTIEVIKTSALSKRWKNLWALVPNIDFDDELLSLRDLKGRARPHVTSFVKFVERVLRLRDASNMKKFRLSCGVFRDGFQIYAWIFHAVMHNVKELDISLLEVDPSVIPRCVFDSTSLISLKIELNVVQFPSHIHLPCLKSLHLSYLQFLSDDYTDNLFSGCPVLETLILSDCMVIHLDNIVISIPSLKSLTIDDDSDFDAGDNSIGCKLKIDAPNLTYFKYIGHLSSEILLNDNSSSSLVKACIHIPLPKERQTEVACRALDLLTQLQNVVSLSLSVDTMEALICTESMPFHFPAFSNLIHLVLTKEIENYTFRALMDMLYFCPILQSICFSEGFEEAIDFREKDRIWFLVPVCVSNCLKTVTYKNFGGNDSEIYFLKRVLKYALVLERMNMCWCKTRVVVDVKKEIEVRMDFETVERSSKACVVNFL